MRTDAIRLTLKQKAALRREGVRLRESGATNAEIARDLGVHPKTVSGWWASYGRIGSLLFEPGVPGRRQGDQRSLTVTREREVVRLITEQLPGHFALAFALWTRSAVGELIEKTYGITLATRTLGEYLRRWGYAPARPQTRARTRTDPAMQIWLEQMYPTIISAAGKEHALLLWGDQPEVNAEPTVSYQLVAPGETQDLPSDADRVATSMVRAVTNRGAARFLVHTGVPDVAATVRFCRRLVSSARSRFVYLIVDALPVYATREFGTWMDEHTHQLTIFYLPTQATTDFR